MRVGACSGKDSGAWFVAVSRGVGGLSRGALEENGWRSTRCFSDKVVLEGGWCRGSIAGLCRFDVGYL